MYSKKLALPDNLMLLRRKGFSGLALWVSVSVIVLSVLLLGNSLRVPLFRGFNGLSFYNSSLVSWPLSLSSPYFTPPPSLSGNNGTGNANSTNKTAESQQGSVSGVVLGNTHFGNFSIDVKDGSFNGTHEVKNDDSPNFSGEDRVLNKTHFGNFTDMVKNGTSLPGEVAGVGNFSFLGNVSVDGDGKRNSRGEDPVRNYGDVNSTVTVVGNNTKESSLSNNGEVLENQSRDFSKDCDIFDGKWVWDDSKPLYPAGSCPHIDRDFDCHHNGRPDDNFVKWKWQPNGCDIPSFNATDFLERLRGQKLVFVGDSLNRNMWESLICILRHSIQNKKNVYEISGRKEFKKKGFYAFTFEASFWYQFCTVCRKHL